MYSWTEGDIINLSYPFEISPRHEATTINESTSKMFHVSKGQVNKRTIQEQILYLWDNITINFKIKILSNKNFIK